MHAHTKHPGQDGLNDKLYKTLYLKISVLYLLEEGEHFSMTTYETIITRDVVRNICIMSLSNVIKLGIQSFFVICQSIYFTILTD